MTDEETSEALEGALRERYLTELKESLGRFAFAIGLNATERFVHLDAVSRLFVRYESWPAYSTWRAAVLAKMPKANGSHDAAAAAEPKRTVRWTGSEVKAMIKARTLSEDSYRKLAAWAEVHKPNAMYKGRDGRALLSAYTDWTDAEVQEAMR